MLEAYNEMLKAITLTPHIHNKPDWGFGAWNDSHAHELSTPNSIKLLSYRNMNYQLAFSLLIIILKFCDDFVQLKIKLRTDLNYLPSLSP